jgi:alcohol dehydrogenase
MYTLGIHLHVGRCHAAALLPEVVELIGSGRLRPEAVTTRVVGWEDAPGAFLEPAIMLVVRRDG